MEDNTSIVQKIFRYIYVLILTVWIARDQIHERQLPLSIW